MKSEYIEKKIRGWNLKYGYRLIFFNIVMMTLFLLGSVGYFYPFFPITTNVVVMTGLILSVVLLGADSRVLFLAASFFWIIALFFKVVGVDVWAERTGIYVYESLFLGFLFLLWNTIKSSSNAK